MKLYDAPLAPNPRRVRWAMAEKAIDDIEIVSLNIMAGEHKQPDYLGRAGLAHIPALEMDDGTTITESIAICRYLESLYPEPNLFGRTAQETAVIEMWMRRAEMLVATPFMLATRLSHPALAVLEAPNPAVADYYKAFGANSLGVLDARLADSAWLGGERLTIADIVAFVGVDFGRLIRFRPSEDLAHLGRWMAAMRERPAAKAGL